MFSIFKRKCHEIIKTKITLINYANNGFYKAQKANSKSGINKAKFDEVIEFSIKDLSKAPGNYGIIIDHHRRNK